jgi:hypothetical protein
VAEALELAEVVGDEHARAHAPRRLLVPDAHRGAHFVERGHGVGDVEAAVQPRDARILDAQPAVGIVDVALVDREPGPLVDGHAVARGSVAETREAVEADGAIEQVDGAVVVLGRGAIERALLLPPAFGAGSEDWSAGVPLNLHVWVLSTMRI